MTAVEPGLLVVFCACDRHNLGDLLFPHLAEARFRPRRLLVAGLVARDLRDVGGHEVHALADLARDGRLQGATLLHAGGEILDTRTREAAVMTLDPAEADAVLAMLEPAPGGASAEAAWCRATIGTSTPLPYVAARDALPGVRRVLFDAVGGVAVDRLPAEERGALRTRLAAADMLAVRDRVTQAHLQALGLDPVLAPDPAVEVAARLGEPIRAHAARGEVAALRAACPDGFGTLQLAAALGDDASLDAIARAVRRAAGDVPAWLVLRAGDAPWHDDARVAQRLAARLREDGASVHVPASRHVFDLCAFLGLTRLHVGTSLHAAIVATAFGMPVVGLDAASSGGRATKLSAWAATWAPDGELPVATPATLAGAIARARSRDALAREALARRWAAASRRHGRAMAWGSNAAGASGGC